MEEAARFARSGYVVFDRIFDVALVEALRAEYCLQFPDVASSSGRYLVGHRRWQVPIQMTGSYLSPDFYANKVLLELAEAALGPNLLIDSLAVVTALPGAKTQQLHFDHDDLFPGNEIARALIGAYGITVAIPLVDLTPLTGTTRLFARSHIKKLSEDEFELPYIERGGCYAMDYRLWHCGTENRSTDERPIIYLVYARPWFTDITNYGGQSRLRVLPPDLAMVPEQHRPLFRRLSDDKSDRRAQP